MAKRVLNNGPKVQKEKTIVAEMIHIYCRKKHHQEELCADCLDLKNYAHKRLSSCRFGEEKSACSNCRIHCYKPEYREKIKSIMRFSGPRMLFHHPFYSIKHLLNKG
ncbi:nitrous oxide-stimulated promoter family protein [Bacillus kwashiorkori]|uniref:nitrous oxide-stimulated promoter family protein n=1 Tax=Bacillus kwashiorkori TaxID=1522318 RepID=UPI0007859773|nr:nitrous oxide-stimulated promoter family protein [Bacillus kwashiorkori]